jgi:hydrogenase maturation factor
MSRIDEHEAHATLDALRALGEVYEQELEDLRSSEVM